MAKELDILSFVKSATDNDARIQIAEGKNSLARYRPYVDAFAKATEVQRAALKANASEVLNAARDKVIAYRKSKKDPNAEGVAAVSDVRIAEFRRIMAFGEYKCHATALNYFTDDVLAFDDMIAIVKRCTTKVVKGKRNGEKLPLDVAAPSKAQLLTAIKERQDSKNREGGDGGPAKRNATKAYETGKTLVDGFKLWFADHKSARPAANKQLDIILNALNALQRIAVDAAAK